MRILLALALLVSLAACGASDDTTSADQIDRDAWRTELTQLDDVGSAPDLDALERLTREDCSAEVDDLALRFTLEGARPDVSRVNMKYVCPDQATKVDEALSQIQDSSSAVDEACAEAPALRTEKQSQLAEAMGCDE